MDDKVVRKLVEDELQLQPSVDAAHIDVSVNKGIDHLNGRVPSFAQKSAIETAVKRVKGVRGYGDDALAIQAANILEWDTLLPKDAIKVKVERGWVTLAGDVEWASQRIAAEGGLHRLQGVRGVSNLIMIRPKVAAGDIKNRIEQALERQAELEANGITITVQDGKVRAWHERDIIERAAWAAPGVTAVDDHVTVGA